MTRSWWKSGAWNALCDVCGLKRKSDQLTERWDGFMVCKPTVKAGCWEMRHPQDLIRPIADTQKLPWTRPEATDQFISVTFAATGGCTALGMLSQADYGAADCMTVNNISGSLIP